MATGRSDYPNQINNVLCFPYLFRAALDCRAVNINQKMKFAAAEALANLAQLPVGKDVQDAYPDRTFEPGSKDYIIPTPYDQRLISAIPVAVCKAAAETGEAKEPIQNYEEYEQRLINLKK